MFETSSDLVKSSVQMVKQSTIGVLKNVSKTGFWKAALNMNANGDTESLLEIDDDDRQKQPRDDVQSFPCFYEALHDQCRIGNTGTKYTKYSTLEVANSKLKLCQILLRVATLSETACYGLEVSDVGHCE